MFKLCTSGEMELFADPRADRHKMVSRLPEWHGTVVGVDIAVEKAREFATLIDYIRKSYQIGRTPAVAARLADHNWTIEELVKKLSETI